MGTTPPEQRVLVWALGRDGPLTARFLSNAGLPATAVPDCEACCQEYERGVAVLVVAEELLAAIEGARVRALLLQQPAWSDVPVVLISTPERRERASRLILQLTNVAILHRPLSLDTLSSTVGAALRARRRQYEVRALLEQREDTNRRRDEFLAMLAHELRNPLTPIRTGLQLLRLMESGEQRERVRKMMERQAQNLSRLIDDLLEVSRITSGKIVLKKEIVEVGEALKCALEARRMQAAEKGLQLVLHATAPPASVYVEADPTRLEQMIDNVLVNAIKYTPEKGEVRAAARLEGDQVVIDISDSGVGIPAHLLDSVFELFAQADRSLERSQGGLGIGLTVVKMLAEQHGGSVAAFSEGEGKGTRIMLCLPAANPRQLSGHTAASGERQVAGASRRVLIVEDNRDAAEMLAAYLRRIGHQVAIAHDGHSGLALYEHTSPEVVICDIGLPGLDGYELARAMRARQGPERCFLIALTGYGEGRDRERGLQAGFDAYLVKPAEAEQISELVRRSSNREARTAP